MMDIIKTTDYFNITEEEAGNKNSYGYTKEENKVLDSGLEFHFYETLDGLTKQYSHYHQRAADMNYFINVFEFVSKNSDNKYCIVLG